ncbi:MAG: glycosyltransferase [Verrucomicrobiales bacterium]
MWLTLLFSGTAVVFLSMTLRALFHLRWAQRLPSINTFAHPIGSPNSRAGACSVVMPARDEEARIEISVRCLLAQNPPLSEIIVIDDRSVDRTGELLNRLAHEDERVKVIRVEVLPPGWLGKCHACHIGASAVTGEWILFTDADCWLKPDVVARALLVAELEETDHIVLTPGIAPQTLGAQAWHLAVLVSLVKWLAGVNRDKPMSYLGMGAFNLVKTSAYRKCGGYEALRLTVVDDLKLGLLLRRAGNRTRGFIGGNDALCQWGTTVRSMIKIMEKNYFALMNYRTVTALAAGFCGTLLWGSAIGGFFHGSAAGLAAGAALLSLIIPAGLCARRLGWSLAGAALMPFLYPALFYAMLNSAFVTLRQGGVRWRETFYALDALRAGNFR